MAEVLTQHLDAIPTMLDWPWWVAGTVIDEETGRGVPAQLSIDSDARTMNTDPAGLFSRPVNDGTWVLTAQAPGYHPSTVSMDANAEPVSIVLTRSEFSSVDLIDRQLSAGGQFTLTAEASSVTLQRPGHPRVMADGGPLEWTVDPDQLAPGAWTLIIDELPLPRGIFVPDDELVHVNSVRFVEDQIELEVAGLSTGARVWALWGEARIPAPLPVHQTSDDTLMVDMTTTPMDLEPIDLILWTQGRQVSVIDLRPSPAEEPPGDDPEGGEDTGFDLLDEEPEEPEAIKNSAKDLSSGGCSTVTDYPGLLWLVSLVGLLTSRRARCEVDGG